VSASLVVEDLSPFEPRDRTEEHWLERLQEHVRASDHVIRLGEAIDREDDFIVYRDQFGGWRAGRYVGELAHQGRRLEIRPRFGIDVIGRWLEGALNLVAVPETAEREASESFIALLMAAVWAREVDRASRHGPPAFRCDQPHEGLYVRGRLDIRDTVHLRAHGSTHVASVSRYRDLDNDVSRTLVAAERVLHQAIGHRRWHTPRINEVLPQLTAVVGARPSLPTQSALEHIRYTPITRPFKEAAQLSWRIARREGFGAQSESGEAEGLLLDVAELWELFLLHCVEEAAANLSVQHGTTAPGRTFLLASEADANQVLGRLKPDIIVSDDNRTLAVIDAKYKHLRNAWPDRPDGVDRADLYQLASYLGRLDPHGAAQGMLLYPLDPEERAASTAENKGPWRTETRSRVRFERIPIEPDSAIESLRALLIGPNPGLGSGAAVA
jgi:5-methylcytosine-specific restriction enzyme subunit McrC